MQTGMVMVIYLEEAVARKKRERGAAFAIEDLRAAVIDGALLRLRPKVMTVSTIIAGLLPIMWSQRVGADGKLSMVPRMASWKRKSAFWAARATMWRSFAGLPSLKRRSAAEHT